MKALILFTSFLFLYFQVNAQFTLNLSGTEIKSGKRVILTKISLVDVTTSWWSPNLLRDGKSVDVSFKDLKKIKFDITNLDEFWKDQAVSHEIYESLCHYGMQYDLRQDWEREALQYLNELEQKNLIFKDSYLENYLYSLSYKLFPGSLNDGRPGILNVKIMIDNNPNAFIFPNGSMVITTGLLSTINSEEELIAVMAHEISHFVLDHSTFNINKAIQRQKSAEFWAAFATTMAAASEIYASSRNPYYIPGALTYSTAILSSNIASAFTQRLGLQYSREQEFEADQCAVELMKFLKIDPTALSSALLKIKHHCIITGNYYAISGNGSHPAINDRVILIGAANEFGSIKYDKIISFVISTNAIIEFDSKHYTACQSLVDRNIKANVPTEDDYILKAMTNLYLYDNPEKNMESLDLINKAKILNVVPSINTFKQEALILIRLIKFPEALLALGSYNDKLDQELLNTSNIKNQNSWYNVNQYLQDEKNWTSKMLYKVKTM